MSQRLSRILAFSLELKIQLLGERSFDSASAFASERTACAQDDMGFL
jgi:hypothetical protein